jgi:hypothetical protein
MIRRTGPRWVVEAAIAASLFAAAAWWGARYDRASLAAGRRPSYYQNYFEPAVMLACGHGFAVATTAVRPPALDDFLFARSDRFDCSSLPPGLPLTTHGEYQYAWFYLMVTVGLAWSILGISWSGLAPLFGLLFGLVVVLGYALFRVAAPRAIAAIGAVALMVSSVHLIDLPHLRDYAKAPFVLALVLLLFWMVRRPLRPRALLALAVLYGAVLGIGYGFRTDLLADIPPFVITLVLFLPDGVFRRLRLKAAALVLAATAFVGAAWPALHYVVTSGGCQWHVVLLGLSTPFNDELGIRPAFYQWLPAYSDALTYTAVNSFWDRTRAPETIQYCSPEYDKASAAYLTAIVTRFPADMLTRALASVRRIVELPYAWRAAPLPGLAPPLYAVRGVILAVLARAAVPIAWAAVIVLGASSLRLGLFALFFLVYFAGYPALQFATRHYFHLEFIGWWALAFLGWRGVLALRGRGAGTPVTRAEWRAFGRGALRFAVIAAALVMVPAATLRAYQGRQVDSLTRTLLDAPRVPLALTTGPDGHQLVLAGGTIAGVDPAVDPMRTAYLDIHIDLRACPAGVSLRLLYDRSRPEFDFSGPIVATPPETVPDRVLVPVYRYFRGLDPGAAPPACISDVERLAGVQGLPLLPVLTLPADWRALPFRQSIR